MILYLQSLIINLLAYPLLPITHYHFPTFNLRSLGVQIGLNLAKGDKAFLRQQNGFACKD